MLCVRVRLLRPVALLLTLLLLAVAGCGGGSGASGGDHHADGTPAPETTEGARPTGLGRTIGVDELTRRFAGAGIVTHADSTSAAPVVPVAQPGAVALTTWQVTAMTHQLNSGSGYAGRDLDALTGTAPGAADAPVPMSVVLAAYIKAGQTPGAALARELLGAQDWDHLARDLVYPDAVLALFAGDLATDEAAGAERVPAAFRPASGSLHVVPAVASAPIAGGACSEAQSFIGSTIDTVVSNLQLEPTDGVAGVLVSIWNTVVEIAATAVQKVVETLTAPVMGIVRTAATVLAVLSSASSLLDPWTIDTTADPAQTHFAVGSASPTPVTVTTKVASGLDLTWPADLKDCASVAGVTLPDPGNAAGSPVSWTVINNAGIADISGQDATLDDAATARLTLTPATETADQHQHGDLVISPVGVRASVQRTAVAKLSDLLFGVVLGALPKVVADALHSVLGPVQGATAQKLSELTQADGKTTFVDVYHHDQPDETETPSPIETTAPGDDCPTTAGITTLPDGVFEGPIELDVLGSGNGVAVNSTGKGTMRMEVEGGKVTQGTWSAAFHSKGGSNQNGVSVKLNVGVTLQGTVHGPASAPVAAGSGHLEGTVHVVAAGVAQDEPLSEDSTFSDVMTVESTTCEDITASWIPSFNEKTNGYGVGFEGTARWAGHRVG